MKAAEIIIIMGKLYPLILISSVQSGDWDVAISYMVVVRY